MKRKVHFESSVISYLADHPSKALELQTRITQNVASMLT